MAIRVHPTINFSVPSNREPKELTFEEVLQAMQNSKHEFELTGSRVFGNRQISDETDYDFFVDQQQGDVVGFLKTLGFKPLGQIVGYNSHEYGPPDVNTKNILRRVFPAKSLSESSRQIDVQICRDAEMKRIVQQVLIEQPLEVRNRLLNVPSPSRRMIWNTLYNLSERGARHL